MAKVYVIGASSRIEEARAVIYGLQKAGHSVLDWTRHFPIERGLRPDVMAMIGREDLQALQNADVVVALHPLGAGGNYELGCAETIKKWILHFGVVADTDVFSAMATTKPVVDVDDIIADVKVACLNRRDLGIRSGGEDLFTFAVNAISAGVPEGEALVFGGEEWTTATARGRRAARVLLEAAKIAVDTIRPG